MNVSTQQTKYYTCTDSKVTYDDVENMSIEKVANDYKIIQDMTLCC